MQVYNRRPVISNLAAILTVCTTLWVRADDASSPPVYRTNRRAGPTQGLVRPAQFGVHSRYPFAESRGGYRYPYSYPYYRYGNRQYPFGNGPYGPYGSNYGGYSGNPYSSGIYGSPFAGPYGEVFGDVQSAEETEELDPPPPAASRPPPGAPEAAYPGRAVISPHSPQAEEEVDEGPGMPGLPNQAQSFYDSQAYGEPLSYFGASPWNPSFGGGNLYRVYPYYNQNNMWFGNHQIQGFGYYPFQVYAYPYGTPSGAGYYSPEYAPQYYSMRNYGPYYPGLSGIKGGAGMCVGW